MAHEVVELLSGLAAKGHTIVASIHQPGSDTFALFSHLCLLVPGVQGARIAFFGNKAVAAVIAFLVFSNMISICLSSE
jgi:hypothetical protein